MKGLTTERTNKISKRVNALSWWYERSLRDQEALLLEFSYVIIGGENRHPNFLTGREIELIHFNKFKH